MKQKIENQTLLYQPKKIRETARPTIAYEHPNVMMYVTSIKENIIRYKNKKPAYTQHDKYIKNLLSDENTVLKQQCDFIVSYISEAFVHYSVWDYSHA